MSFKVICQISQNKGMSILCRAYTLNLCLLTDGLCRSRGVGGVNAEDVARRCAIQGILGQQLLVQSVGVDNYLLPRTLVVFLFSLVTAGILHHVRILFAHDWWYSSSRWGWAQVGFLSLVYFEVLCWRKTNLLLILRSNIMPHDILWRIRFVWTGVSVSIVQGRY